MLKPIKSVATLRATTYVWVTWLTKLISGEESFKYKLWFKANHKSYSKVPNSFKLAKWCEEHTALIEKKKAELLSEGYEVYLEDQNSFAMIGNNGATLAGKADIVAIKGDDVIVVDCKTGRCRNSDITQVKLYMLSLPIANELHRGKVLRGQVQYKDSTVDIPHQEITDQSFLNSLRTLMQLAGSSGIVDSNAVVCASYSECNFCDLTKADCSFRIDQDLNSASTSLF